MFSALFTLLFVMTPNTEVARWLPHVTPGDSPFQTRLIFSNSHQTQPQALTLRPFTAGGEDLPTLPIQVDPGAFLRIDSVALFGENAVSHFAVEGSDYVQVLATYQALDGGITHVAESRTQGRRFEVFQGNRDQVWDGMALINLGDAAATVVAVVRDEEGAEQFRATLVEALPPKAKTRLSLETVFEGDGETRMTIESSQVATVLFLRGSRGDNSRYLYQTAALVAATTPPAELVFHNAAVFTATDQQAQAVAVSAGKILYVGDNSGVQAYIGEKTVVHDLKGNTLMPGFHDVHMHPLESGSFNGHFELDVDVTNAARYQAVVRRAASDFPNTPWLIGYGHSLYTLLESDRLPVEILDEAVPDRPVIIMEQTSHSMWCNSKALELAGIDADTANPTGGIIDRDPLSGRPSGILIDNAGNQIMDLALAPTPEVLENDYRGLIGYTLPELAKHGITSLCDARTYWKRKHHLTWKRVEAEGRLSARVNLGLWAYPGEDDAAQLAQLKALFADNKGRLRFNQIKVYADGIVHNTTAALKASYNEELWGIPGRKGLNYFTEARLAKYIKALDPLGFDFHIHAIGDRGIHEALNAIAASQEKGRHRLTHLEIVDPGDLPRFRALNVTADCQVAGEFSNPDHWHEAAEWIGTTRADNQIPLLAFQKAGARLTLSSDWNVSPFNPFLGLQNAVTRAPQAIGLTEALKAYTINSAYVMRHEERVGSIEVGKLADLVVLDRNLTTTPVHQIAQAKVLQTYLEGELIYRRNP